MMIWYRGPCFHRQGIRWYHSYFACDLDLSRIWPLQVTVGSVCFSIYKLEYKFKIYSICLVFGSSFACICWPKTTKKPRILTSFSSRSLSLSLWPLLPTSEHILSKCLNVGSVALFKGVNPSPPLVLNLVKSPKNIQAFLSVLYLSLCIVMPLRSL